MRSWPSPEIQTLMPFPPLAFVHFPFLVGFCLSDLIKKPKQSSGNS
ncbi:MAG: hypothetical protein KatS3mg105_2458 [Gemmatales bacterium]|nr:MAG: hypothetical protein KatS3mg105_2458 [Gemmatales bacterium]